jgi:hypothetical protein
MVFKLLGKWWWPGDLAEVAFIVAFALAFLTVVVFNYAVGITLVLIFLALAWALKADYIKASWFVPKKWRNGGGYINVPLMLMYIISLAVATYYFWPILVTVVLIPLDIVLDDTNPRRSIKNAENRRYVLDSPKWEVLVDAEDDRCGWLAAKRRSA